MGIIKMVHTFCTLYNKFLKSYDQSHSGLTPFTFIIQHRLTSRVPIHFHYMWKYSKKIPFVIQRNKNIIQV